MKKFFFTLLIIAGMSSIKATDLMSEPRDSSTNLINKALALKLFEDGVTFFNMGQNKEALSNFKDASIKDPYNWKIVFYISLANYELNY